MSHKVRKKEFLQREDWKILDQGSSHKEGRMVRLRRKIPSSTELSVIVRIRTVCGR